MIVRYLAAITILIIIAITPVNALVRPDVEFKGQKLTFVLLTILCSIRGL